jgi:hypothetical protein
MSKKLFVVFMSVAVSLVLAASAMAFGLPEASDAVLTHLKATHHTSGISAGTILNPEGKGDVLIFPYYDVRELNGKTQDFHFFIINDEDQNCLLNLAETVQGVCGYAAKVRFREWDKSEEVFDFDIWLSRGDVWYGRVTHNTGLALPYGARITTPETDYVIIEADNNTFTLGTPFSGGFDFPVTAYIPGPTNPPYPGPLAPKSPGSNNLYGYIEVIGEERTFDHYTPPTAPSTTIKVTRTHADALNTLKGYAYILRVADGASLAYNATAIANFSLNQGSLFYAPGGTGPSLLADAEDTLDQVEFQLSKFQIEGAYDIEAAIAGQFSMIINFPTKHFHFCPRPNSTSSQAWYTIIGDVTAPCNPAYPTGNPWFNVIPIPVHGVLPNPALVAPRHANDGDPISVVIWDRNEHLLTPPKSFVSPAPSTPGTFLPYELNIVGLYLGTPPAVPQLSGWTVRDNVAVQTSDGQQSFDRGYIEILFPHLGIVNALNQNALTPPQKIQQFYHWGVFYSQYIGLPVIGLSLQEFANGNVGGFYGDIREAWYDIWWNNPQFPPNP